MDSFETPPVNYDIWYAQIFLFLLDNWLAILVTLVFLCLGISLFNKIVSPYIYEHYKRLLFFDTTLQHMKDVLEMDYDVLWNQPDFCLAFLKYHEEFQTFLNEARTDMSGKIRKVSRYNKYTEIDFH